MKKIILPILIVALIGFLFSVSNVSVSTNQCINYKCHTVRLPLYLKALDFFDRHYNFKQLSGEIVKDTKNKEGRALKLLEWTSRNISRPPKELPIIDDHIWYTIVRGYAADDQFQDIFATLCNYAGLDAFFCWVVPADNSRRRPFSFVKFSRGWSVFDAYNGVYFINKNREIADSYDIIKGNWQAVSIFGIQPPDYYGVYLKELDSVNFKSWEFSRPAIQFPIRRILFWKKTGDNN